MKDFYMKEYELKVQYLNDQFGRMWTRFNFFLTIESGLVAGQIFAKEGDVFNIVIINWAIVFISAQWYLFGAQDKYLVDNCRYQVKDAFNRFKANNNTNDFAFSDDIPYVGEVNMKKNKKIKKKEENDLIANFSSFPASWRFRDFSVTHLAAYVPLLLLFLWIGIIVI